MLHLLRCASCVCVRCVFGVGVFEAGLAKRGLIRWRGCCDWLLSSNVAAVVGNGVFVSAVSLALVGRGIRDSYDGGYHVHKIVEQCESGHKALL